MSICKVLFPIILVMVLSGCSESDEKSLADANLSIDGNISVDETNSSELNTSVMLEVVEPVLTAQSVAVSNTKKFAILNDTSQVVNLQSDDNASFSFSISSQPTNGILTGELSGYELSLIYIPHNGFIGNDSFEFSVEASDGNISIGTIAINVLTLLELNKDTDGDGLSDLDELNLYGTSPILADTDADGFSDFKEIITYGFDANVNNLRFNPLIADIPQIDVQLTSVPDIYMNYTTVNGTSSSISTSRSQSSSQAVSSSETSEESTSVEKSHTKGIELSITATAKVGTDTGLEKAATITGNYSETEAHGSQSSQSWTQEQTKENSTALENGNAFEESNEISTSGGGITVSVRVSNGGDISYTLNNLFLSATYMDLSLPNPIVPIGNLAFENARTFPAATLAPNEISEQLNFSTAELSIDTTKSLLQNSNGLILSPAVFDMLDENGVSYTFNSTGIQAQDALVMIDFAGLNNQKNFSLMVATNANPEIPGLTIDNLLRNVLKLSLTLENNESNIESISGVENKEPKGRWIMVHGAQEGNNEMKTTVYTTPTDHSRVQSINLQVSNIVSDYNLSKISLHGGDIFHVVYLQDSDQDGLSNREESFYGTNPNEVDSDGDLLNDGLEVNGWVVSYLDASAVAIIKLVSSNPLVVDTDGDGLSDFVEANHDSNSSYKRDPRDVDTDGDGLSDALDDYKDGNLSFSAYDNLDLFEFLVETNASTKAITLSYTVRDVTELNASNAGNGITDYRIHIYRHIIPTTQSHQEPTAAPIDFAPVLVGQTLSNSDGTNWELIEISSSIPGAVTTVINDGFIDDGNKHKYIVYLEINNRYMRSAYEATASAEVEHVTIHFLPGDGTNNTALTGVRTLADLLTKEAADDTLVGYSAAYDEIFINESVFSTTTGVQKFWTGDGRNISNPIVSNQYRYSYERAYLIETPAIPDTFNFNLNLNYHVIANCWQVDTNVYNNSSYLNGYVTDAIELTNRNNIFAHPLGIADGAFTLDWRLHVDGKIVLSGIGGAVDGTRRIRTIDTLTDVQYEVNNPPETTMGGINTFDTSVTLILPAEVDCYRLRLGAWEVNNASGKFDYSEVADPAPNESVYWNLDDADLCRDENGIWSITPVRLLSTHESATVSIPATIADNPNFIDYTTRSMVWDDDKARTTMNGTLRVNYQIEVTKP